MSVDVELLTVQAAAIKARVSTRTISTWISTGKLAALPSGRVKLIRSDHLQQLMRNRYQARKGV